MERMKELQAQTLVSPFTPQAVGFLFALIRLQPSKDLSRFAKILVESAIDDDLVEYYEEDTEEDGECSEFVAESMSPDVKTSAP
ncbi:hypothetical protein LguiA_017826 [Lonicera macranthoides]